MTGMNEAANANVQGSDQIIARILEEARQAAQRKRDEAQTRAAALREEARRAAEAQAEVIRADGREQAESIRRAAGSAASLSVRNARLRQRRRELDETLTATLAYLNALPDEEYFGALYTLLRGSAQPGKGILRLNARDLARLPADFDQRIRRELEAAHIDGSLTVSGIPCAIDGGFLLQYGEIEINAAFAALAEEKREALEDLIHRELFG